jgi:predicted RNA-binding protein YlqC (UPF0109 family)
MAAKDLVEYIAKGLVDAPTEVSVVSSDDGLDLELRVAADDRGKVIGKKGRTAHAIRTVLQAVSAEGQQISLDIVD